MEKLWIPIPESPQLKPKMDNSSPPNQPPLGALPEPQRVPPARGSRRGKLPSLRAGAVLATAMLGIGIAVGAALGPAPETSLAGSDGVVQKLPALVAAVAASRPAQTPTPSSTTATVTAPAITPQATPSASASAPTTTATTPAASTTPTTDAEGISKKTSTTPTKSSTGGTSKLPPITSVWLIELSGTSFSEALASPTASPYISGQLIPKGTFLTGWSALSASAFANDAALAEKKATVGGTPPILHTIVQPPCPEGAPGATCAAGTPGALTAADEFLKATLATITATTTYSEHGLVVVTFATVADPAAAELQAGSSSATLTSQPPAGVVLLSPFATAGAKPTTTFNPISPKQSLEKLLHANA
jgi:hypothetical protein